MPQFPPFHCALVLIPDDEFCNGMNGKSGLNPHHFHEICLCIVNDGFHRPSVVHIHDRKTQHAVVARFSFFSIMPIGDICDMQVLSFCNPFHFVSAVPMIEYF